MTLLDIQRVRQYRDGCEAQWKAADELVAGGENSLNVDGGYAWVGWNNFERCRYAPNPTTQQLDLSPWIMELCPKMRPEWFVTFYPPGEHENRSVVREIPYLKSSILGDRSVYVIRRQPSG